MKGEPETGVAADRPCTICYAAMKRECRALPQGERGRVRKETCMREGSAPNFCPPTEEGVLLEFIDENGDAVELEFLGLILHGERRYGFFFPVSEDAPAGSSGEVLLLEVTELDEDGQPSEFELVDDEGVAAEVYADFCQATKTLYDFE